MKTRSLTLMAIFLTMNGAWAQDMVPLVTTDVNSVVFVEAPVLPAEPSGIMAPPPMPREEFNPPDQPSAEKWDPPKQQPK